MGRDGDRLMPFETGTTPFTGDNDIADFLTNAWLPFARDEVKWADNQAPTRSPEVLSPEAEVWTHRVDRVGSPGADVSPFTPKPPFVQFRTDDTGDHLHVFTGFGVDDTQDAYDQPNNPMNCPQSADFAIGASGHVGLARCILMNELIGTFDKYWLFADTAGRYVHCVIKVAARHYRHFHVGLLTPLHPDLDPDSFYVTGQWWDRLGASGYTTQSIAAGVPAQNTVHDPYNRNHMNPFWNRDTGNELGSSNAQRMQLSASWYYMPGLAENSPEIVWYKAMGKDSLTYQDHSADSIGKGIGDVNNTNDSVIFGCAHVSGHPDGLGSLLFSSDRTFTSNAVPLVPIYVGANVDFASANRCGVAAQIPDIFRISMANIAAEEEITVGSDTYVCFPLINKDSANVLTLEGYSGFEGLAYKKITASVDV